MKLLIISLAPVLIIAFYVYWRDKYEREPWKPLLLSLMLGGIITVPIIFIEGFTHSAGEQFSGLYAAAYESFIVAGVTEEFFKFMALLIFIWKNKNFNELFDGIVYAVFISLGFAAVENILYVYNGDDGVHIGIMRAFTAVPAHALFGISMGYFFGLAKFGTGKRYIQLILALTIPIILHGGYDFILMSKKSYLLLIFIPYLIGLWFLGLKKMKIHSENSIFKVKE